MLDENLKNVCGESNIEVRKRMQCFLEEVLNKYAGKRIAVVSHGGAIKFLLQTWCKYNYENNVFVSEKDDVFTAKLASPSILKLTFQKEKIENITYIDM